MITDLTAQITDDLTAKNLNPILTGLKENLIEELREGLSSNLKKIVKWLQDLSDDVLNKASAAFKEAILAITQAISQAILVIKQNQVTQALLFGYNVIATYIAIICQLIGIFLNSKVQLILGFMSLCFVLLVLVPVFASKCEKDASGKRAWEEYQPTVFWSAVIWFLLLTRISALEEPVSVDQLS